MEHKEIGIRILIAMGCMIAGDVIHHFIQHNVVLFIAGAVYMGISEGRSKSNKDSNTITFTDEEVGKIDASYDARKDYSDNGG